MSSLAKRLPLAAFLSLFLTLPALAQNDEETREQIAAIKAKIAQLQAEVEVLTATMANAPELQSTEIPQLEPSPQPTLPQPAERILEADPVIAVPSAPVISAPVIGAPVIVDRAPVVIDWVPSSCYGSAYPYRSLYRSAYYAPDYYDFAADYLFADPYFPYRAYDYGYGGFGYGGFGYGGFGYGGVGFGGVTFGFYPGFGKFRGHGHRHGHFRHPHGHRKHW